MVELLAEVTRTGIVESRHYGHVAVCNSKGEILAHSGDPEMVTFIRSACKPVQALNLFVSGAADKFDFTDKELAIMCSSHYGEPIHQEVVLGLLDKIGCTLDDLETGCPYSIRPAYYEKQLRENIVMKPYNSDCSGKHCGFLAGCIAAGYPTKGYSEPDHPLQKDVLKIVSEVFGVEEQKIGIGTDGCGVPVHAMPLKNMAMAYARFTSPERRISEDMKVIDGDALMPDMKISDEGGMSSDVNLSDAGGLPEKYRDGAKKLFNAINAEPDMIAGPGGFCTELVRACGGRLIGKIGAEAVYCVGFKDRDLGIAVKIDDGNMLRVIPPVVISVLDQLDLLSETEKHALKDFASIKVINDHGNVVGEVKPVVDLKFL